MTANMRRAHGRPSATDHATIERAAFALFAEQGFDETTMEDIANAVGIGRRTLFRYFPSKNDIPWGQFDDSLRAFHDQLDSQPPERSIAEAVHRCIISFNDFDPDAMEQHRVRMRLILTTPALQAHSALKYQAWRRVIADYVASRTAAGPDDPLPAIVGHVSLALAVASYERWLEHPELRLTEILVDSMDHLASYLA